jgi:predicted DNA-binding transcriptional regulator YafY
MDQPASSKPKPRWGQARRLAFIDLRLRYDGRINRRDLTEFFDISHPQASADLASYQEARPDNLRYDASSRSYLALDPFRPLDDRTAATSYLDELQRLECGVVDRDESFVGFVPPTGVVASPARTIEGAEVAVLVRAIRAGTALKVQYQSMDQEDPLQISITPHAIGFDGLRWHTRAYCHQRQIFRDFAIGRLTVEASDPAPERVDASKDDGWRVWVNILLVPNPNLSKHQKTMVMRDYGMSDGQLVLPCRKAMLFYTLRHLNLEKDEVLKDAARQHVIVSNRKQVDQWLVEDRNGSSSPYTKELRV